MMFTESLIAEISIQEDKVKKLEKENALLREKVKAADEFVNYICDNQTDPDFHADTHLTSFVTSWIRRDIEDRQLSENQDAAEGGSENE